MSFLKGKTAIITGAGRAVLSVMADAAPLGTELQPPMPRKALIL